MRIVDVRPESKETDITAGRTTIKIELARPATNVMLIRGSSADVSHFADRAAVRSDAMPWRSAVWVKSDEILTSKQEKEWFRDDDDIVAVIFDFDDTPLEHLEVDATLTDIEIAFLKAQGGTE